MYFQKNILDNIRNIKVSFAKKNSKTQNKYWKDVL